MNQGILRKLAVAGVALLLLVALTPSLGLALSPLKPSLEIEKPPKPPSSFVNVTYCPNAGDNQENITEKAFFGVCTIISNPFSRSGCTFTGWNTKADGSGTTYKPQQDVVVENGLILYAQWKEVVDVTYKKGYFDSDESFTDTVDKGSSYKVKDNPFTRSGYTFTGWTTQANGSGTTYKPGQVTTVNANMTLYAQWIEMLHVTYNNTVVLHEFFGDIVAKGSSYTVKENMCTPALRGYTFDRWNTKPDGTGYSYEPGQVVTVNSYLTLYTQWKGPDKVSVKYKKDIKSGIIMSDIVNKGSPYTIRKTPNPPPPGKNIHSWNTKPDFSGTWFIPGDIIKNLNADLVLYELWGLIN